jgi:hypothetical protein
MDTIKKLETQPVCGKEYNLIYKNKSCKCIHKSVRKTTPKKDTLKKAVSLKSNPCKKGKMKNENGRCVLIKNLNKSTKKTENPIKKKRVTLKTKKPIQDKPKSPNPILKKRIAAKTKKPIQDKPKSPNPILKKRIAAKTKKPRLDMPESRNSIIIKNRNTPEQNVIKNEISKIVSKGDTDIIPQLTRIKSYSPLVNQEFVTNNEDRADIFKCANSFNDLLSKYSISVGKYKNGKPKCKSLNSQEAKDILMYNLNNIRINEDQIIAPIQKHSNCWFNALFVCFFFSDKGRKFFKYFRRLMIQGKHPNGTKMPAKFAKGLMIWNLCIEASYDNKDLALSMNTNKVIELIYQSLYKGERKNYPYIRNVKQEGNPITYYHEILNKMIGKTEMPFLWTSERNAIRIMNEGSIKSVLPQIKTPDVLFLQLNGLEQFNGKNILATDDFLTLKLDNINYQLDSVTVRDTAKRHFCALITVNGKGMGFDGASFSRLNPFDWKPKLQDPEKRNIDWEFEGSIFKGGKEDGKAILWNFNKSYLIFKYYRI